MLLTNLSISNVLGCLLVLTGMIRNIASNNTYDGAYCDITALSSQLWWLSNIFTLMFLSLDHYIYIINPFAYYRVVTKTKIYIFITFTWVLSATISLIPIFAEPRYIFRIEQHTCGIDWTKSKTFNIIFTIIVFCVPCLIMIYCYVRIVKDARKTFQVGPKNSPPMSIKEKTKPTTIERKSSILSRLSFKPNHQDRRLSLYGTVRTSFIIFGTFVLAWTPQFTLIILHALKYNAIDMNIQKTVHTIKYIPIFIYPFIFGFRNLRKQFQNVIQYLQHFHNVKVIHPATNIDETDYPVNVSRRNSQSEMSETSRRNSLTMSFKDFIFDQSNRVVLSRSHSVGVDIASSSRSESSSSGLTTVCI